MAGFTPQSIRNMLASVDSAVDSVLLPAVTAIRETATAAYTQAGVRGRACPPSLCSFAPA